MEPMPEIPWGPAEKEAYRLKVLSEFERLRAQLPDIDSNDLMLILASMHRPFGTGKRFLLRPLPGGGFVF
jgi:hypothetical protein